MPGKGFPPKPTVLKALEGFPSHGPRNRNEPQYASDVPERPVGMSPGARKYWARYVEAMGRSGVLTLVDGEGLAALCEDKALLNDLRKGWYSMVAEMRRTLKAAKKKEIVNPSTVMAGSNEGRKRLSSMGLLTTQIIAREREFGLMPGSRSRVEIAPAIGPGGRKKITPIEQALCG